MNTKIVNSIIYVIFFCTSFMFLIAYIHGWDHYVTYMYKCKNYNHKYKCEILLRKKIIVETINTIIH